MAVARPTGPDQADVACRSMKFNDRILLAYPPQHGTLQTEWRVSDAWKICNCTELAGLKQGDISMRARTMADINIVCYGVFVCDSVCVCVCGCVCTAQVKHCKGNWKKRNLQSWLNTHAELYPGVEYPTLMPADTFGEATLPTSMFISSLISQVSSKFRGPDVRYKAAAVVSEILQTVYKSELLKIKMPYGNGGRIVQIEVKASGAVPNHFIFPLPESRMRSLRSCWAAECQDQQINNIQ
jgi:hypothetical protein